MVRRKIRPLGIVAVIAVFLLYQFVRRGGHEVFTFDSLPPYTDTEHYVRKPNLGPQSVPDPPPPPPEWGRPQPHPEPQHDRISDTQPIHQQPPQLRPQIQDPPLRDPPSRDPNVNRPQNPVVESEERPAFAAGEAANRIHTDNQEEIVLTTGHHQDSLDQPPQPGDFQPGHNRHVYTAEELAPRIEKHPLAPQDVIQLPKGQPLNLPRIQARFSAESTDRRRERVQRQAAIKRAMKRSWEAYATYAMGHDEVRPISGRYYDPFCGWGATLVDSLDTLQIMGMEDEYRDALRYVAQVDFAHTRSYNIPVFETVIRYLGGLLGAYDMSGGKDTILLEKARDLGDMLMGAFDTVNRMPLLRYDWRPQAARQNLRAKEDSCLAELGTLTLEFTRLAQLTGNHSYFDAVQRITDGFEDFEFSHIPGLYPLHVDASGCRHQPAPPPEPPKPAVDASTDQRMRTGAGDPQNHAQAANNRQFQQGGQAHGDRTGDRPQINNGQPQGNAQQDDRSSHLNKRQVDSHSRPQEDSHLEDSGRAQMSNAMRESLSDAGSQPAGHQASHTEQVQQVIPKCEPQGLVPSLWRTMQEFSFGGEADSTYEYFLKEHLLLGGVIDQYRSLYAQSIDAAQNFLFFRPLVEGDPEIMFAGKYRSYYNDDGTASYGELVGEMQHLTCFVGGMLAMGAKILNRPHDLVLAERITDGCVWAYNITATGVMPETFAVDVCYETPCHWTPPPTLISGLEDVRANTRPPPDDLPPLEPQNRNDHDRGAMPVVEPQPVAGSGHHNPKRAPEPQQLQPQRPAPQGDDSRQGPPVQEWPDPEDIVEPIQQGIRVEVDPDVRQQAVERVQAAKANKKLNRPPSFHDNMDTRYILRPEAIESVFYMWRITGDPKWQDKGWQMWESIERVSWTELAYSAIVDVNDVNSTKADSMESFFLAETLKYFYLLYSEPDVVSLDDWVFNTEAHPFRRPKPGVR